MPLHISRGRLPLPTDRGRKAGFLNSAGVRQSFAALWWGEGGRVGGKKIPRYELRPRKGKGQNTISKGLSINHAK